MKSVKKKRFLYLINNDCFIKHFIEPFGDFNFPNIVLRATLILASCNLLDNLKKRKFEKFSLSPWIPYLDTCSLSLFTSSAGKLLKES